MSQRPFVDHAELSPRAAGRLRAVTSRHRDLSDVLEWGRSQVPPVTIAEAIAQDEYSHDVIVPVGEHYVVYGTTCLGGITSVAVWKHHPTPDQLLDDRLRRGFRPLASPLQTGDAILGYAACRLRPDA